MSSNVKVVWDEELTSYDPGPGHPLRPIRLDLTVDLARRLGVLQRPGVSVAAPVLIRKLACCPETVAPPRTRPRQPAASTRRHALSAGGFLNVEPPVRARTG